MRGTDGTICPSTSPNPPPKLPCSACSAHGACRTGLRHSMGFTTSVRFAMGTSSGALRLHSGRHGQAINGHEVIVLQATSVLVLGTRMPADSIACCDVASFVFPVAYPRAGLELDDLQARCVVGITTVTHRTLLTIRLGLACPTGEQHRSVTQARSSQVAVNRDLVANGDASRNTRSRIIDVRACRARRSRARHVSLATSHASHDVRGANDY